jgi:hypothetical protein
VVLTPSKDLIYEEEEEEETGLVFKVNKVNKVDSDHERLTPA